MIDSWSIRFGPPFGSPAPVTRSIVRAHLHPLYDARDITAYFNVAVLEVDDVPISPSTRPVCLPTKRDGYWGDLLQGAKVTVQGNEICSYFLTC